MAGIVSQNPATEEILQTFEELSDADLEKKLGQAKAAAVLWRGTAFSERSASMKRLAALLRAESRSLGELATREMGKPIAAAVAEVEKCALVCEYYAENAEKFLSPESVQTDAAKSYVRFDPLGVILAVMPWNFPYWQVMRFAAPAVMAGNVGLLKHASNVPQCALAIEECFRKAGFPEGAFQTLLVGSLRVAGIIRDPRVAAVTLTGSEVAGSQVAQTAGSVIKKTVLELGGSDPFIILKDADLPRACEVGSVARLQNNGQSCIAAKRFIVEESVLEDFLARYAEVYRQQVVGDPFDDKTAIGPLATAQIRDAVERQVQASVQMGAKVVVGGKRLEGKGFFYEPTILRDVRSGMPAYDEEVFGPVAAVIAAKDAADAIRIANDSPLGLGASLWTQDTDKAEILAREIEAGSVFINGMVKSDPRLPFGGVKRSGYGRELSEHGIKEFVNIKTVWVGGAARAPEGPAVE